MQIFGVFPVVSLSTCMCCVRQTFDTGELVECVRQLVKVDQEWVPYSTTSTLYIRPTMIGTEVRVRGSRSEYC